MSDFEPPQESGDGDSGGGLASFFSTTPKVIGSISGLIVAVTGLLIALNGVLGDDTADSQSTTSPKTTTGKPPPQGFSEFDRRNGKLSFKDGTMSITAKQPRSPVVALSNQKAPLDVAMSTRVEWKSGAYDYGVSLICRRQNAKTYYLLGVIPSEGRYSIKRYRDGNLSPLAQGRNSHVRTKVNNLTASCLNGRPTLLKLVANGKVLAQKLDPEGLAAGDVGIRVGTNQQSEVTVDFTGFKLRPR